MNDSISTTKSTKPLQADKEVEKPLAPLWMFKLMNPIMTALLRSRLHGVQLCSLVDQSAGWQACDVADTRSTV